MRQVPNEPGALSLQASFFNDITFASASIEIRGYSITPAELKTKPYYYSSITDSAYIESLCGPGIFIYGEVTLNMGAGGAFQRLVEIAQDLTGTMAIPAVARIVLEQGKLSLLDFWADLTDRKLLAIGQFAIKGPRLHVYTREYFPNTESAYSETLADLISDVTVQAGVHALDIALGVGVSQTGVWNFDFVGSPEGSSLADGVSALASLVTNGQDTPGNLQDLPDWLGDLLDDVYLSYLYLQVTIENGTPKFQSMSAQVGIHKTWNVIPGKLAVSDPFFGLHVSLPFAEQPANYTVYAPFLGGTLDLGAKGELEMEIFAEFVDGFVVFGVVSEASSDINNIITDQPDLSHVLGQWTTLPAQLPVPVNHGDSLSIQNLEFRIDTKAAELGLLAVLNADLNLGVSINGQTLTLSDIGFTLERQQGAWSGTITAQFLLSQSPLVGFRLQASNPGGDQGWSFDGVSRNLNLSLGDLATAIGNLTDGAFFPEFLTSVTVQDVEVGFNSHTGDFNFALTAFYDLDTGGSPLAHPVERLQHALPRSGIQVAVSVARQKQSDGTFSKFFNGNFYLQHVDDLPELQFALVWDDGPDVKTFAAVYENESSTSVSLYSILNAVSATLANELKTIAQDITIDLQSAMIAKAVDSSAKTTDTLFALDAEIDISKLPPLGTELSNAEALRFVIRLHAVSEKKAGAAVTGSVDRNNLQSLEQLLEQYGSPEQSPPAGGLQTGLNFDAILFIAGEKFTFATQPTAKGGSVSIPMNSNVAPNDGSAGTQPQSAGNVSWIAINKNLGPLHFKRVGIELSGADLVFPLDASVSLGGLSLTLLNLRLAQPIATLNKLSGATFALDGLSLSYQKGDLTIAGAFLDAGTGDYEGEIKVDADDFGLTALGAFQNTPAGPSLFVYGVLDAALGGPPFFFVEGLAIGFGYNRTLLPPSLGDVGSFPLIAQARNPASVMPVSQSSLAATLASLDAYLPAATGKGFIVAGLRFSTFQLMDTVALLAADLGGEMSFDLIGMSTIEVPAPDESDDSTSPLAYAALGVLAGYTPSSGVLKVAAQLTQASFVISRQAHITGGADFYAWFKDQTGGASAGEFVLTLGGYDHAFQAPSYYPFPPRIGLDWRIDANMHVAGQLYFALVPHAVMAGGALQAAYNSGSLTASFDAGLDILMGWQPYHYALDAFVDFDLSFTIHVWFVHKTISIHVGASLAITGPDFGGTATIDISVIHVTIAFGADAPAEPQALTWDQFVQRMLPGGAEPAPAVTPIAGVRSNVKTQDGSPVMNAEQFALRVDSAVPFTQLTLHDGDALSGGSFGIAPMNQSGVTSTLTVTLNSSTPGASGAAALQLEAITKNVPAALWGSRMAPGLNDESFIAGALTGCVLRPQADPVPDVTVALPLATLLDQLAPSDGKLVLVGFQLPALARAASLATVAVDIESATPTRETFLRELGFDPDDLDLDPDYANLLRAEPLVASEG